MREKIASKVLADRLKKLAADNLIKKRNHPTNKKVFCIPQVTKVSARLKLFQK